MRTSGERGAPRLGLAVNAGQFTLLVAVNALVGGLLGTERTVLPLLAGHTFHLGGYTAALTYILAFGATKAVTNVAAGTLAARYGLRPAPFLLAAAYVALGLGVSAVFVRETHGHARHEASAAGAEAVSTRTVAALVSVREPALSAAAQAGMVNNLNDGLAWGLFPVLFTAAGLSLSRVGVLAALYPAVWGLGQLVTGWASDRYGRKRLIVAGMLTQGGALAMVAAAHTFGAWALAVVLLGAGTAAVYPTLLAVIADVAHPTWRARAVGVYRLWRDGGFAVGAVLAGILADAYGIRTATLAVAGLTALSGLYVWRRMYETRYHPEPSRQVPPGTATGRCTSSRGRSRPG